MKHGFIIQRSNAAEMMQVINQFQQNGINLEYISINKSFEEFLKELSEGDMVVVWSYADVFSSLTELFVKTIELSERCITLHSICEPHMTIQPEQIVLIRELNELGSRLRAIRTRSGLSRAKASGVRLGRPQGATKGSSKTKRKALVPHKAL